MGTKDCGVKQLNFGIDRILSHEFSRINTEKLKSCTLPVCSISYPYPTNYNGYEFLPNYGNLLHGNVQNQDSHTVTHFQFTSIANNFANVIGSNNNIVRPAPVRPIPKETVSSSASSTSHFVEGNNNCRRRTWTRAVFSSLQRKGLEKRFAIQKYITKPDRRQLAATLGLTDAQVKVWFQNRRMKWRHTKEIEKTNDTQASLTLQNSDKAKNFDDEDIDVESNV